ncbi:eef1akmt3, partial [Symbiodinium natans]
METAALERGNCHTCRQRRVLGCWLNKEAGEAAFRCCACLDEHGSGDVADMPAGQLIGDCATNWWACSEPPEHLLDVPPGFLSLSHWNLGQSAAELFTTVCDPDHSYFSGLGAERVWHAGLELARHLWQSSWPTSPSVVELGAGCGLPGMVLARRGARVTLTDVPWLLKLIEYNIEANFVEDDPLRPSVSSLRWGSQEDLRELQK